MVGNEKVCVSIAKSAVAVGRDEDNDALAVTADELVNVTTADKVATASGTGSNVVCC